MHPETHGKIMYLFGYAFIAIIPLFFLSFFLGKFIWIMFIFYPLILVIYLVLRYLPVHCSRSGCKGKMMVEKTRRSYSSVVYTYVCPDCSSSYEEEVFELQSRGAHGGGHQPSLYQEIFNKKGEVHSRKKLNMPSYKKAKEAIQKFYQPVLSVMQQSS